MCVCMYILPCPLPTLGCMWLNSVGKECSLSMVANHNPPQIMGRRKAVGEHKGLD